MEINQPNGNVRLRRSVWRRQSLSVLPNYLKRAMYVLIIPTVRGLIYALASDLERWLQTAWMDLASLGALLLIALFRWWFSRYSIVNGELCLRRGFLFQRDAVILRGQTTSVEEERSGWMRLCRASKLTVRSRGASISLYVNVRRSATLRELLGCGRQQNARVYRPGIAHLGLYALLNSDSLGGVIFVGVLISRFGSILGREVREEFVGALTRLLHLVAYGVPGAMLTTALLILAVWALSFARTVVENAATELRYTPERITLTSGSLVRRRITVGTKSISAVEVRKTLPGLLFGLGTAYMEAPGLRTESERLLMLSAQSVPLDRALARLLPDLRPARLTLRPFRHGWLPYIWMYATALIVLIPLPFALTPFLTFWEPMLRLVCWMGCVPAFWLLLVSLLGFRRSGVGMEDDRLTISRPFLGSFRRITVSVQDVRMIEVRRFCHFGRGCGLVFWIGQERLKRIALGAIPYREALRFVETLERRRKNVRPQ